MLLFLPLASGAADQGIKLNGYSANIILSEDVQNALDNGVTLSFVASTAERKRWLLFSWASVIQTHKFELSRHALSNNYLLRSPTRPTPKSFAATRMALEQLSRETQLFFSQSVEASDADSIEWTHRLQLDIYSLPTPMRLDAFLSGAWNLDSGWQP